MTEIWTDALAALCGPSRVPTSLAPSLYPRSSSLTARDMQVERLQQTLHTFAVLQLGLLWIMIDSRYIVGLIDPHSSFE